MTMQIKLILALVALLALGGLGWKAYDIVYDRGVAACNATWQAAQAKAEREQAERERAAQDASDAATDTAADQAELVSRETRADTEQAQQRIDHEYASEPAKAASCTPAGDPAPVPPGVLRELDAARQALGAA